MRSKRQLIATQKDSAGAIVVLAEDVGYTVKDAEAWMKTYDGKGLVQFVRPVVSLKNETETVTRVKRA